MSNLNENKISFNWYPGHMEKTKRKIKEIITELKKQYK